MEKQLKTRQICLFFIAFMPVIKFFVLPSRLSEIAREDMWISTLVTSGAEFLAIVCILFQCVKRDVDFFTLLKNSLGTVTAKTVTTFYALFFLLKALNPVFELCYYVKLTLYEAVPSDIYFFPFFVIPFFLSLKPLRVLGRCADVAWVFTIVGIAILITMSVPNMDLSALLPVGVRGAKAIFSGGYLSLNWFGDGAYLLLFMGNFKCDVKGAIKIACSYLFAALLVAVYCAVFYCIFYSTADRQSFSLTEISKYSTSINNIGRFDYIGIVCVLSSELFAVSLPFFFGTYCVKQITQKQNDYVTPIIYVAVPTIILLFYKNRLYSIGKFLLTYGNGVFALANIIIPILSIFLREKNSTKKNFPLKEKSYAVS